MDLNDLPEGIEVKIIAIPKDITDEKLGLELVLCHDLIESMSGIIRRKQVLDDGAIMGLDAMIDRLAQLHEIDVEVEVVKEMASDGEHIIAMGGPVFKA